MTSSNAAAAHPFPSSSLSAGQGSIPQQWAGDSPGHTVLSAGPHICKESWGSSLLLSPPAQMLLTPQSEPLVFGVIKCWGRAGAQAPGE